MNPERTSNRGEALRIARNSAILGSGQALTLILGFFTTVLVTDKLGADGYGLFIGAQRFVWLFVVLAQFGLLPLTIRAIARREDAGAIIGTVAVLRAMLSVAFAICVVGAAAVGNYLPENQWILWAFVAMEIAGAFAELFVAAHEGLEEMGRPTLVHLLRSVFTFVGVAGVGIAGGGLVEIVSVYLGARVLQLVGALALAPRGLHPRFDRERVRPLLRQAAPFVAIAFADMALRSVDITMLARFSTIPEASRYGAALNFLEVLFVLPMFVQRALLPAFSRLHLSGGAGTIAKNTLITFSALLIPLGVGIGFLADQAVALYPSAAFADSAPVLEILALTLVVVGIKMVCAMFLTGSGHLWHIVVVYAVAAPAQISANLLFIPDYGANGAAIGTVIGQVVAATGLLLASRRLGMEFPLASLFRHLVAATAMVPAILATRQWIVIAPVLAGGIVYLGALALISPSTSLERKLLAEAGEWLRRRRSR